jgi:hypothetical protein
VELPKNPRFCFITGRLLFTTVQSGWLYMWLYCSHWCGAHLLVVPRRDSFDNLCKRVTKHVRHPYELKADSLWLVQLCKVFRATASPQAQTIHRSCAAYPFWPPRHDCVQDSPSCKVFPCTTVPVLPCALFFYGRELGLAEAESEARCA